MPALPPPPPSADDVARSQERPKKRQLPKCGVSLPTSGSTTAAARSCSRSLHAPNSRVAARSRTAPPAPRRSAHGAQTPRSRSVPTQCVHGRDQLSTGYGILYCRKRWPLLRSSPPTSTPKVLAILRSVRSLIPMRRLLGIDLTINTKTRRARAIGRRLNSSASGCLSEASSQVFPRRLRPRRQTYHRRAPPPPRLSLRVR